MNMRIGQRLAVIGLGSLLSISLSALPSLAETANGSEILIRQGLPGRRIGGGTRAPELAVYNEHKPLIALIPENNIGITTEAYPTLLFHVPVLSSEQEVEFLLYNSADELMYDGSFNVAGDSGIVDFDLSTVEDLPPLAANETYKWYFLIIASDRSQDIVVDGWLHRVASEELAQYQRTADEAGIQFSSLIPLEEASDLYALRQTNGQDEDIVAEWNELLYSIGLSHLSEDPVSTSSLIPIANE